MLRNLRRPDSSDLGLFDILHLTEFFVKSVLLPLLKILLQLLIERDIFLFHFFFMLFELGSLVFPLLQVLLVPFRAILLLFCQLHVSLFFSLDHLLLSFDLFDSLPLSELLFLPVTLVSVLSDTFDELLGFCLLLFLALAVSDHLGEAFGLLAVFD